MLTDRNFCMLLVTAMLVAACDRNASTSPSGAPSIAASGAASSAAPSAVSTAPPRPAVAVVDAGVPNTSYALVAGTCTGKVCPAEIELVVGGRRLDAVPLEFGASDAKLVANADQPSFAPRPPLSTYTAGEDEGAVTTLVQPVRLAAQRTGLLVQQAGGFEHVKRRRDVFVIDDNKLRRVWSKQDAPGPVRSHAEVVSVSAEADAIVLIEGMSPDPDEADQVTAQLLAWQNSTQTLQGDTLPSMAALVVGRFKSAAAARSQYADPCLADHWLLRGSQVGEDAKHFVLALLAPDAAAPAFPTRPGCSTKEARLAQFRPR